MRREIIIALLLCSMILLVGSAKISAFNEKAHENSAYAVITIDETDQDYLTLKNARVFAVSGVSDGGKIIPEEIHAFARLFENENAVDYFYKLELEANNQGKLYALCGLFYLDYDYYMYLLYTQYCLTDEMITYAGGCILLENWPISELIADFYNGFWPGMLKKCIAN